MHKNKIIPYNRQSIDNTDIKAVANVLKSDFLTTGPECLKFEKKLADYVGAKYAIACSSGTAALHLSLMALDIKKGDKVVTTANTFVSFSNSIRQVGAKVIFLDIDTKTANIDLNLVENLFKKDKKIKAIIPVHFAGFPVEMKLLNKICKKYNVKIIEDGCHALGGSYRQENNKKIKVGSCQYSNITTFSFHPIKNITTGEGGAVITNNKKIYNKLLCLRSHGINRNNNNFKYTSLSETKMENKIIKNPWYYEMHFLSHNYRITDFQAALGNSQLLRLDKFTKKRQNLANYYRDEIDKLKNKNIEYFEYEDTSIHAYHLFCVKIDFKKIIGGRANLMNSLLKLGVQTQVHYIPIYKFPYYKKYFNKNFSLKNTEKHYESTLSLPIYYDLPNTAPKKIIKKIIFILEKFKKNK